MHRIFSPSPSIYIQYGFIDTRTSGYLLNKVDHVGNSKTNGFTELNGRRSFTMGGSISKSGVLLPSSFPAFISSSFPRILNSIEEAVSSINDEIKFKPNHILVNEYNKKSGILPHTDGQTYISRVATLSLGSHTILILTPPTSLSLSSIKLFLPPRSLLVLSNEIYDDWKHAIEGVEFDSMEDLKSCGNWDDFWEHGAQGLDDESDESVNEETEEEEVVEGNEKKDKLNELAGGLIDLEISKTSPIVSKILGDNSIGIGIDADVKLFVAKRRMVEFSNAWERNRRVSLTVRQVKRVYNGLKFSK